MRKTSLGIGFSLTMKWYSKVTCRGFKVCTVIPPTKEEKNALIKKAMGKKEVDRLDPVAVVEGTEEPCDAIEVKQPEELSAVSGVPKQYYEKGLQLRKKPKSSMQSGTEATKKWELAAPRGLTWTNPLMGWTSTGDAHSSLSLEFPSKESAVEYCRSRGWAWDCPKCPEDREHKYKKKSYADNFRWKSRARVSTK